MLKPILKKLKKIYNKVLNPSEFISQKGQDEWIVNQVFHGKQDGFFVDLASTDGKHINNTFLLEKKYNWQGICIEPNPEYFIKLQENRNAIAVNACIDFTNHEIDFRLDHGDEGGIVGEDTDNNFRLRKEELENSYKKGGVVKMMTKTLEQVLDENKAPSTIDYLSLDVEGNEMRVFKNFPFHKYKFLAMTIERPTPELNKLLFANDYVFVMNSKKLNPFDTYYVHKSIPNFDQIKKEKFEQVPPKEW